jgi:hypothetical protein
MDMALPSWFFRCWFFACWFVLRSSSLEVRNAVRIARAPRRGRTTRSISPEFRQRCCDGGNTVGRAQTAKLARVSSLATVVDVRATVIGYSTASRKAYHARAARKEWISLGACGGGLDARGCDGDEGFTGGGVGEHPSGNENRALAATKQ